MDLTGAGRLLPHGQPMAGEHKKGPAQYLPRRRVKKRAQISSEIRAELEQRGVDSVRALLIGMANGSTGTSRDTFVLLSGGKKLRRGDMEDWLREEAANIRWIKPGAIAAITAAVLAFLAWVFPIK